MIYNLPNEYLMLLHLHLHLNGITIKHEMALLDTHDNTGKQTKMCSYSWNTGEWFVYWNSPLRHNVCFDFSHKANSIFF